MARRLVPFVERHQATLAIHNQVDGDRGGAIGGSQLADALALSSRFALRLDVGNLTTSGRDAVADLRTHAARISHVVLKDRLRNGGASQPFGEGDTPIDGVMNALQGFTRPVPAFVEYDYVGVRPTADEIATSLAYATRTLE
jgi:sugar phosphate isomerase/epimerase